jgi:hypothetical protein
MGKKSVIVLSAIMTILVASIFICAVHSVYAARGITKKGTWPENWPKELEPLRAQALTQSHTQGGNMYEIPFTSRDKFESVWPHILAVKSEKAPLILSRGPYTRTPRPFNAGVRILSPSTGALASPEGASYGYYGPGKESLITDKKLLRVGPPWPDYIKSESGGLPKYVVNENGKWAPYDSRGGKDFSRKMRRARIDIELIVDGEIVDLNRIPLPADTPIIDKRFQDRHNK